MDWFAGVKPGSRFTQLQPYCNRSLRVAPEDEHILWQHMKVLEDAGIIKSQKSRKIPKILLTQNFSVLFSADYYNFKNRKVPDLYSIDNIENALNCLVGNKIYTILGIDSEMHQIPMYPGEREKPYTVCPLGYYESERWQPGYCESLASFQSLMSFNLRELKVHGMLPYLDYLIVFGTSYEPYKYCLARVIEHFKKNNWMVSPDKSLFCCTSVPYAGHEVSAAGIAIDPCKLKIVSSWPTPRTVTELRCFLDFCKYYQQFLAGYQKMCKPLRLLLRKALKEQEVDKTDLTKQSGSPWWTKESIEEQWTKECQEAFEQLKKSFNCAPVLARANMSQPHA